MKSNMDVKTYGCKVNTYDTGLIQKQWAEYCEQKPHLKNDKTKIVVINSCAVTQEATREALREARYTRRKNPESLIIFAGCAAQVDGPLVDATSEIDLVIGNSHKSQLPELIEQVLLQRGEELHHLLPQVFRSNIFRKEELGEGGGEETHHTRSFLKIQDGCNSFCSFCIIPYARGKSRSLSVSTIVEAIQKLVRSSVREVVLTGVHIGDYQGEQGETLEDLIEAVLNQTSIERIRLGSLEPIEITDRLINLFNDSRLCRHFHMSIQSANTRILKEMKRNYSAEQVSESLLKIAEKVPGAFVGMDVITGFPSETEQEFLETLNRLRQLPWTRIHVFPYSERAGTKATLMQAVVPVDVRKERAQKLRELSRERYAKTAQDQVGQHKQTLLLKDKNGIQGLTRDYWPLFFQQTPNHWKVGDEVLVNVKNFEANQRFEGVLYGEVVDASH